MEKINVEERVQKARDLFYEGYNCTQSVFLAYSDLFGFEQQFAAKVSAPFGGGMGRLREVCGAVSGMSMLAGQISPNDMPGDKAAKTKTYALVQEFAEKFRAKNGAIVCRELLGLGHQKDDPTPSDRTPEYYKKRPCVEYIAYAARIVGEKLVEENFQKQ